MAEISGDQGGRVAQGPVGDALHQDRHAAGGGHADQQGQAQVAEGADGAGLGQDAGAVEGDERLHAAEGPDGEDLAMGEIDELEDAVHHGVAQGDGGVDEADGHAVDEHLGQVADGVGEDADTLGGLEDMVGPRSPAEQGEDDHDHGTKGACARDKYRHLADGRVDLTQVDRAHELAHRVSGKNPPLRLRGGSVL